MPPIYADVRGRFSLGTATSCSGILHTRAKSFAFLAPTAAAAIHIRRTEAEAAETTGTRPRIGEAPAMQTSAGTLLYRRRGDTIEVLIVHASGNFNRHAPWGIPKGIPKTGESLVEAARRETTEETGVCAGELAPLGDVVYRSRRKHLYCFFGEAPADAEPRCASWEVDAAQFVPIEQARAIMHQDQALLLDRLMLALGGLTPPREEVR